MTVWILLLDDLDGSGDIRGVFSSRDRAEAALTAARRPGDLFSIEEWDVDDA